jgi:hypothetical protein
VITVQVKLCVALILNTVVASLLAAIPVVIKDESTCYAFVLGLMLWQGCNIAFLQSALYGIAGVSHKLTNNLMVGIGMGGVSLNLLRIILKASVSR